MNTKTIQWLTLALLLSACQSTATPDEPVRAPVDPIAVERAQLEQPRLPKTQQIKAHAKLGALYARSTSFDEQKATYHNRQATLLWHKHGQAMVASDDKRQMAFYTAQALFQRGEAAKRAMEQIMLAEATGTKLQPMLNSKADMLKLALGYYQDGLKVSAKHASGTHWPVACMVQMGQMTEHLANDLLRVPIPATLNGRSQMVLRQNLLGMRTPLLRTALKYYAQALRIKADSVTSKPWKSIAKTRICTLQPTVCKAQSKSIKSQ